MTVVEKIARAMQQAAVDDGNSSSLLEEAGGWCQNEDWIILARASLTALHDSFADPVVRAAIQAALDEKEG